jgi:hypothetical protein
MQPDIELHGLRVTATVKLFMPLSSKLHLTTALRKLEQRALLSQEDRDASYFLALHSEAKS